MVYYASMCDNRTSLATGQYSMTQRLDGSAQIIGIASNGIDRPYALQFNIPRNTNPSQSILVYDLQANTWLDTVKLGQGFRMLIATDPLGLLYVWQGNGYLSILRRDGSQQLSIYSNDLTGMVSLDVWVDSDSQARLLINAHSEQQSVVRVLSATSSTPTRLLTLDINTDSAARYGSDGTIYVAISDTNRIQHYTGDGVLIAVVGPAAGFSFPIRSFVMDGAGTLTILDEVRNVEMWNLSDNSGNISFVDRAALAAMPTPPPRVYQTGGSHS